MLIDSDAPPGIYSLKDDWTGNKITNVLLFLGEIEWDGVRIYDNGDTTLCTNSARTFEEALYV